MSAPKILSLCFVWLLVIGAFSLAYKFFVAPQRAEQAKKEAQKQAEREQRELLDATSGSARFEHMVQLNLDSFSGYSVLRSKEFHNELSSYDIGLRIKDDQADYTQRLEDIQSGKSQYGVFTIDSLITASHALGEIPGTIIFVIDESRGADAGLGVSRVIDNIDVLNTPETKFVIVPDSPNETFARLIISYFNLDKLEADPFIRMNSAKELYEKYRKNDPQEKNIFVTWEPYVSKIVNNPDYKILVDSSKFRGYIVDVMVVSRDYLKKNPTKVIDFTKAYFSTLFHYRNSMPELLVEDSIAMGEPLKEDASEVLYEKILWRNTMENYAHFGIARGSNLQHIGDIISNVISLLKSTGGIKSDPTDGKPRILYYDGVLSSIQESGFHPGTLGEKEEVREDQELQNLSDKEWDNLEVVATLDIPNLVFARGTSKLTTSSKSTLDYLANKLNEAPQFYLMIKGSAGLAGDLEANKKLAMERAEAAKKYLIDAGISESRIRATGGEPTGQTIVTFVLGQSSY